MGATELNQVLREVRGDHIIQEIWVSLDFFEHLVGRSGVYHPQRWSEGALFRSILTWGGYRLYRVEGLDCDFIIWVDL